MAVLLVAMAFAGAATAAGRPATETELEVLREAFEPVLMDAQSARLRDVVIGPDPEGVDGLQMVCGKVNAKNRLGAYVGYTQFLAMISDSLGGPGRLAALPIDVEDRAGFATRKCQEAGLL